MTFFLDENFPKKAIGLLERTGHTVIDIRGTNKEGLPDNDIFNMCKEKNAVFLTTDRDFYHTIHLTHKPHKGIVVIAIKNPNTTSILEKLIWFLGYLKENSDIENKCFLIKSNNCNIFN